MNGCSPPPAELPKATPWVGSELEIIPIRKIRGAAVTTSCDRVSLPVGTVGEAWAQPCANRSTSNETQITELAFRWRLVFDLICSIPSLLPNFPDPLDQGDVSRPAPKRPAEIVLRLLEPVQCLGAFVTWTTLFPQLIHLI